MTEGKPISLIVRFTIPILMGNLLQLCYTIADTRIIGSFLGDEALAAVGSTTALYTLILCFFTGMANGFGIIIAKMFGAKDMEGLKTSYGASLVLGAASAIIVIAATLIFMKPILRVLNVPEELMGEAVNYISIVIAGLIITMLYCVVLAGSRAIGDSLTPLLFLIMSVGLNIAGDLVLIGVLHTGVWGAAVATVASQFLALIASTIYILRKYDYFRFSGEDLKRADGPLISSLMTTGISMGLMGSLICIGSFVLQTSINGLGNSYIVAQTAARRITEVLMSIFVATGQALSTYCSQNYGAGRMDRVRMGINAGYKLTCSWCVIVLIIVYTLAGPLVAAVTGSTDQVMIDAATLYLRVDSILYVLVAVIFVLRHSLQGVGDRVTPLVSSGIEMAGKVILTFTLVPVMGYMGVILVEPIVWIVMIIPLIVKGHKVR